MAHGSFELDLLHGKVDRKRFLVAAAITGAGALGAGLTTGSADANAVTVTYWMTPIMQSSDKSIITSFMSRNPGIVIKPQYVAFDGFFQKVQVLGAAGQAPDVFFCSASWINDFARMHIVADLAPYAQATFGARGLDPKTYFTEILPAVTYQGKLYALPWQWNGIYLYYNKTMFDKAGIKYPDDSWTYATLRNVAKELTRRAGTGKVEQYGMVSNWDYVTMESSIHANGGAYLNASLTKSVLESPQNIATIQYWVDLIHKDKVAPPPEVFSAPGQSTAGLFASQKVAMFFDGGWDNPTFRTAKGLDFDVALLPKGTVRRAVIFWPDSFCLSSHSPHPAAAWKFMLAMINRPPNTYAGAYIPFIRRTAHDPIFAERQLMPQHKEEVMMKTAQYVVPLTTGLHNAQWTTAMNNEISLAFLGNQSVPDAVKAASAAIDGVLASG